MIYKYFLLFYLYPDKLGHLKLLIVNVMDTNIKMTGEKRMEKKTLKIKIFFS
jgi:hypothetical protein